MYKLKRAVINVILLRPLLYWTWNGDEEPLSQPIPSSTAKLRHFFLSRKPTHENLVSGKFKMSGRDALVSFRRRVNCCGVHQICEVRAYNKQIHKQEVSIWRLTLWCLARAKCMAEKYAWPTREARCSSGKNFNVDICYKRKQAEKTIVTWASQGVSQIVLELCLAIG